MKKKNEIHLRCTEDQKKQIEKKAEQNNMGISSYLLQSALKEKACTGVRKKQWVSFLVRQQQKINVIDFLFSSGAEEEEIQKVVQELKEQQEEFLWLMSE